MNTENIAQRLELIEKMIVEGRRIQEYWGEIFVLWGVGYALAFLLMFVPGLPVPINGVWAIAMSLCGLISGYWGYRSHKRKGNFTTIDRVIGKIWNAGGATLFISCFLLGPTGYVSSIFIVVTLVLGLVNFACGLILQFKAQMLIGVLWWITFVCYVLLPNNLGYWAVFAMVIIGEILFGIYLMILERRDRARGEIS